MCEVNKFDVNRVGKVVNRYLAPENADCDAATNQPDALEGVLRRRDHLKLGKRRQPQMVTPNDGPEARNKGAPNGGPFRARGFRAFMR